MRKVYIRIIQISMPYIFYFFSIFSSSVCYNVLTFMICKLLFISDISLSEVRFIDEALLCLKHIETLLLTFDLDVSYKIFLDNIISM